jgi:hypothetical protein
MKNAYINITWYIQPWKIQKFPPDMQNWKSPSSPKLSAIWHKGTHNWGHLFMFDSMSEDCSLVEGE